MILKIDWEKVRMFSRTHNVLFILDVLFLAVAWGFLTYWYLTNNGQQLFVLFLSVTTILRVTDRIREESLVNKLIVNKEYLATHESEFDEIIKESKIETTDKNKEIYLNSLILKILFRISFFKLVITLPICVALFISIIN